jgi:hypothetical protein
VLLRLPGSNYRTLIFGLYVYRSVVLPLPLPPLNEQTLTFDGLGEDTPLLGSDGRELALVDSIDTLVEIQGSTFYHIVGCSDLEL